MAAEGLIFYAGSWRTPEGVERHRAATNERSKRRVRAGADRRYWMSTTEQAANGRALRDSLRRNRGKSQ